MIVNKQTFNQTQTFPPATKNPMQQQSSPSTFSQSSHLLKTSPNPQPLISKLQKETLFLIPFTTSIIYTLKFQKSPFSGLVR